MFQGNWIPATGIRREMFVRGVFQGSAYRRVNNARLAQQYNCNFFVYERLCSSYTSDCTPAKKLNFLTSVTITHRNCLSVWHYYRGVGKPWLQIILSLLWSELWLKAQVRGCSVNSFPVNHKYSNVWSTPKQFPCNSWLDTPTSYLSTTHFQLEPHPLEEITCLHPILAILMCFWGDFKISGYILCIRIWLEDIMESF